MKPVFQEAFRILHETGLGIVDVGSRDGLHPMFKQAAPLIEAVGFEADIEEYNRLNNDVSRAAMYRSLKFLPFGLGGVDGERMLHLCRSRGTSSLYRPNRSFLNRFPESGCFDVESQLSVAVRSLDGIVGNPNIPLPKHIDFMKVDTQGSELEILQGARKTLCSQVVAVEVEVESLGVIFPAACGGVLHWVREAFHHQPHLTSGQLMFGDALYLRDPLDLEQVWMPQNPHQTEALVLLSVLYDLHDFALEIVSVPGVSEMLDVDAIKRYVLQRSSRLNRPWKRRARGLVDLCKLFLGVGGGHMGRFNGYERRWVREDCNFYSML